MEIQFPTVTEREFDYQVTEEASSSNENKKITLARCSSDRICAICFGDLKNKSYPDCCFHMFCFSCLLNWSMEKSECPSCKQSFRYIELLFTVPSLQKHYEDCLKRLGVTEEASSSNENKKKALAKLSPDRSCAICLGDLNRKSYPDSCSHFFCLTCLLKWSMVKSECPLCKQSFENIDIVWKVPSLQEENLNHLYKSRMQNPLYESGPLEAVVMERYASNYEKIYRKRRKKMYTISLITISGILGLVGWIVMRSN